MITGELKNKIDSLWDIFAAGGLVNPLDVIEQITYLMFIRDLDDSDNLRAKEAAMLGLPYTSIFAGEVQVGDRTIDGQQLKWSVFHDFAAGKMYAVMQEWVFPFIKNLHGDKNSAYSKYMDDAIFKLPTPLLLSKVVDALDEIYRLMNESQAVDVRGDTYEYLLSKIAQSGLNGQFRTPRHKYAASTTGFVERVCSKPALHQHRRHHAGHERNVPGCDPAGHGSGDGRGTGPGAVSAGIGGKYLPQLPQRLLPQNRQDPAG